MQTDVNEVFEKDSNSDTAVHGIPFDGVSSGENRGLNPQGFQSRESESESYLRRDLRRDWWRHAGHGQWMGNSFRSQQPSRPPRVEYSNRLPAEPATHGRAFI